MRDDFHKTQTEMITVGALMLALLFVAANSGPDDPGPFCFA
jgi:hypothetical protein